MDYFIFLVFKTIIFVCGGVMGLSGNVLLECKFVMAPLSTKGRDN